VTLPPGRVKDATRPCSTGSATPQNTIGTDFVARAAATAASGPSDNHVDALAYEVFGEAWQQVLPPGEQAALARVGERDADDWPALACALLLGCPVWTEDADFFGTGVATWTTDHTPLRDAAPAP